MKKTLFVSGSLLLTLISPSAAFALDTPSVSVRPTIKQDYKDGWKDYKNQRVEDKKETREEFKEIKVESKENTKEIREEAKKKLESIQTEKRKATAKLVYERLKKELVRKFEYYSKLKLQLEKRIAEIDAKNLTTENKRDTGPAKAKLLEWNSLADKYHTDLAALDAKITEVLAAEKPLSLMPQVRTSTKLVRDDLQSLKKVLTDTLKLLVKAKKIETANPVVTVTPSLNSQQSF